MYNYLCNQCLSSLKLWVRIPLMARCSRYKITNVYDKVCKWLATNRWFSPATPVSYTNETDLYDITEILLKVELNIINQVLWVIVFNTLFRNNFAQGWKFIVWVGHFIRWINHLHVSDWILKLYAFSMLNISYVPLSWPNVSISCNVYIQTPLRKGTFQTINSNLLSPHRQTHLYQTKVQAHTLK